MTTTALFRRATALAALAALALTCSATFAFAQAALPGGARPDSVRRYEPGRALADSARRPADMPPRPAARLRDVAPAQAPAGPAIPAELPGFWRTRAERTLWKQTADYDETMRYCKQLEAGSRWVKMITFGKSGQGRDLVMLVVSKDRAFTPEAARATGKPVVLIQNGIHSGEIEGKDASLALVRDMAVLRSRQNLIDSCIVLVVPIFSVDAHERRSKFNRLNQNGPEEMGWRVNPTGLNINRDYVKAETPEMRALLTNVYTKWWPELLVDDHTTDGADYQHDVTYGLQQGPQVPEPIARWYAEAFEGRVVPALAAMGHLPAPYLNFRGPRPSSGIDMGATPPRFSTGYPPLHARASVLVETHMLKPYGDRVKATYDLLVALLDEIRVRPRALTGAVRAAEASVIARARETNPARRTVVLAGRTTDKGVPFAYRGKVTTWETSDITGAPVARYGAAPWDTTIMLYREVVPTLTVQQPAGYLVPQEWTRAIDALDVHGIRYRRLVRAWRDSVEMLRVTEWSQAPELFEGHRMTRVAAVKPERQLRSFRPGDVWVPLDQPSAALAVNLFEPQAPDGLMAWNAFDTIFPKKEYGEDYVMEPIAKQMLAKDPKLAKEFADRLAVDSTFAKSPWARTDFFYRRSPWADPEQDLHPIARALRVVPESMFAPAPPPTMPGGR
ncbi:MAG: peptidase M14 [Candidatus Eisenbacteria bacterium]|uniref:Peptidase M14 n=1 Tax=Eiseniibacteriota bacterium TaxID=2212470 RepID=A0A933SDI9_UNCEI|nr:peptidase M14 [Candidatus Eisenbacteria bacterium]